MAGDALANPSPPFPLLSTDPFPSVTPACGTEGAASPSRHGVGDRCCLPHMSRRCPWDAGMGLPAAQHLLPAPSRRTHSQ